MAQHRRHQQTPWRRDPTILARLPDVERKHLAGWSNVAIAEKLGLDESTIRADIKRLNEIWLERLGSGSAARRARRLAELDDVRTRAISAAEWDESCEKAVLFGVAIDEELGTVHRDDKGSAQFRGNKAAALSVARAATMDAAKLEGLVVDKAALTDEEGKGLDLASILTEAREIISGSNASAEPVGTDPAPQAG